MSKPGIFDPWRQSTPKPPPLEKAKTVSLSDVDNEPEERCVTFDGKKGGLNVWVDASAENPSETAQAQVKSLLEELKLLRDSSVNAALARINPTGGLFAETVALAVRRALTASPQAAALIARKRVKAYVK